MPTAAQVSTPQILPGTLLAADCRLGLHALGAYVTQVLARSSQTYGGFVAVAGLLSWLLSLSKLILIGCLTAPLRTADWFSMLAGYRSYWPEHAALHGTWTPSAVKPV